MVGAEAAKIDGAVRKERARRKTTIFFMIILRGKNDVFYEVQKNQIISEINASNLMRQVGGVGLYAFMIK